MGVYTSGGPSERIVAKRATWVKIKNREYSQAAGREDFFDRRRTRAGK
jgi:hypothetical protein